MTSCPVGVTTISSSMRAALQPSVEGQNVSRANTMPGLISTGCSNETRRLITGFSQIASPMPWPYCNAKAASSLGKPKSLAFVQSAAISAVVRPGRGTRARAVLQREGGFFVGKTEIGGLRPDCCDLGGGASWAKATDFGFPN